MPKTGLRSHFLAFLHSADVPDSEDHTEEKGDHSREEQREKQLIKDQNPGRGNGKNDFAMICTRF